MFKRLLTVAAGVALVAMLAQPASAQEGMGIRAGIQGGVTYYNLTGDDVGSSDSRIGFAAGAFAAFDFSPFFGLNLEGNWVQMGAENITATGEPGDSINLRLAYIQVPLTLRGSLPLGEKTIIGAFAGVAAGISTTCQFKGTAENAAAISCDQVNQGEKSLVWSVPVGVGVTFNASSEARFILDVRYDYGITEVFKAVGTADAPDVKNSGFQLFARGSYLVN